MRNPPEVRIVPITTLDGQRREIEFIGSMPCYQGSLNGVRVVEREGGFVVALEFSLETVYISGAEYWKFIHMGSNKRVTAETAGLLAAHMHDVSGFRFFWLGGSTIWHWLKRGARKQ